MDERARKALDKLLSAGNYADVCPDTVERVFISELEKRADIKQASRAARAKLHALTGAFMTPDALRRARKELALFARGDLGALERALSAHASTRERLLCADALYERVFKSTGTPASILDVACGLNPLYLGARGLKRVTGLDIHGGCVDLINHAAALTGFDIRAELCDITLPAPARRADIALCMKLLPVLETQKPGEAMNVISRLESRYIVITFPTRTLCGKSVGMAGHYSEWMNARADDVGRVLDVFEAGAELVYVFERNS